MDLPERTIDAWARLLRVSQSALARVESRLANEGFPPLSWYDMLLELRRAGKGGLRPFELQQEMLLAQYNLSRLADRVVRAGYARRMPCPQDGRGSVLEITVAGRELLDRMWPAYRAAIADAFADRLTGRDISDLLRVLGRLE